MLTRVYIDNFSCFVNFEYRPDRKQLILGRNGSGKSTLLDALLNLRQFVVRGDRADDLFRLSRRTLWLNQSQQTWEIEAKLGGGSYVYRLVVEPWGDPPRTRVAVETVSLGGRPIFKFEAGEVHLYGDRPEHRVTYPFDWHRSALATMPTKDNTALARFKHWFSNLLCFRIDPFRMGLRAEGEDLAPNVNLSNIASWYRHLLQAYPKENAAFLGSLRAALDDFSFLGLEPVGENVRLLFAEFTQSSGKSVKLYSHELSDGQRCLIGLYAILHFVLAKGSTVIVDEPDNFVSLREIQPWLMAVADLVERGHGQILLISHHPELINQWAPDCGVQFIREGVGPVRVDNFHGDPNSALSPAELIARGWESA